MILKWVAIDSNFELTMDRFYDMGNNGWYAIELVVCLLIAALALMDPPVLRTLKQNFWRYLKKSGQSRRWSYSLVIGFTLVACGAMTVRFGVPVPRIHDEFSYLLGADTFANGRLSNPPLEAAEFFESFHINVAPTYGSKYPPAQAMMLAAGQFLFGLPIAGVWFSMAVAAGALLWMLRGWVPGHWALLTTLLMMTRLSFYPVSGGTWSYSYWGGAVAMTGGALVWGAVARLRKDCSPTASLGMGIGLVVLAASRPYEGLLCALPAAVVLVYQFLNAERKVRWLAQIALPIALILACGGFGLACYNMSTTGSATKMAYTIHGATYSPVPIFNFLPLEHRAKLVHPVLESFYKDADAVQWKYQQSMAGRFRAAGDRIWASAMLYAGGLMIIPLALGAWTAFRSRKISPAVWAIVFVLSGMSLCTFFNVNYLAPLGGLFGLLLATGMRKITTLRLGKRGYQRQWLAGIGAAHCALALVLLATFESNRSGWAHRRQEIQDGLSQKNGSHLVFVEYKPDHIVHNEWVYNQADLASAKVVWARDMGDVKNRELVQLMKSRRVWRVTADQEIAELIELDSGNAQSLMVQATQ